ncbi:hypothetical protein [Carboxylicivirga linearis]|uniref:Lipoprotein n=1 Tax=Carboxylicivirga linearis TaxID=1628157 RepID=A0ABS5K1P0_9BACT|nr:hypothetical protein [Carboxylicivirga linearis]MBS2101020.1 hypothetical protein [Carboxylicivirga linearis]
MKLIVNVTSVGILALMLASCDRPNCENKNPIFDKYDVGSERYKTELVAQIKHYGQKNLKYWFDSYIKENGNEYIIINIQNDSLCAKGKVLVRNWNKLEGIKQTQGKGYRGAELKGLVLDIEKDTNGVELIYSDVKRILD